MLLANNPSSSQTEDAVRGFVTEVSCLYLAIEPGMSVIFSMLTGVNRRSTKLG